MVINRSSAFGLKLSNRNLMNADYVPGDNWGGAIFGPRGII